MPGCCEPAAHRWDGALSIRLPVLVLVADLSFLLAPPLVSPPKSGRLTPPRGGVADGRTMIVGRPVADALLASRRGLVLVRWSAGLNIRCSLALLCAGVVGGGTRKILWRHKAAQTQARDERQAEASRAGPRSGRRRRQQFSFDSILHSESCHSRNRQTQQPPPVLFNPSTSFTLPSQWEAIPTFIHCSSSFRMASAASNSTAGVGPARLAFVGKITTCPHLMQWWRPAPCGSGAYEPTHSHNPVPVFFP